MVNYASEYQKIQKIFIITFLVGSLLISGSVVTVSESTSAQKDKVIPVKTVAVPKPINIKTVVNKKTQNYSKSSYYKNKVVYVSLKHVGETYL